MSSTAAYSMGPDREPILTLTLEASPEDVSRVVQDLTDLLGSDEVASGRAVSNVRIVVAEILNNICEHAYRGTNAGLIHLSVGKVTGGLWVETSDHGLAMPGLAPPDPKLADTDVDLMDLPEGGFGWFLIRRLSDDLVYQRVGDENRLACVIPFG